MMFVYPKMYLRISLDVFIDILNSLKDNLNSFKDILYSFLDIHNSLNDLGYIHNYLKLSLINLG